MSSLFIIRGLPGSGKTELAHEITSNIFSADDYFINPQTGEYTFIVAWLPLAHSNCIQRVRLAMQSNLPKIAVANTFSMRWEMQPYYDAAKQFNYRVYELTANGKFTSIHDVPQTTIDRMKARWEE